MTTQHEENPTYSPPNAHGEEGIGTIKATVMGLGALTIVAGGFLAGCENPFGSEKKLDLEVQKAALTHVSVIDPRCWIEYGTHIITRSDLSIQPTIKGFGIPLTKATWWQRMDARYSAIACSDEFVPEPTITADGRITITVSDEANFKVKVSRESLRKNPFTGDSNPVGGIAGGIQSFLGGLPLPEFIKTDGVDNIEEALQLIDEATAVELTAEQCGQKAYEIAKQALEEKIEDSVYEDYLDDAELYGFEASISRANVTANLPETPQFSDEYTGSIEDFKSTDDDLKLTLPDLDSIDCTAPKDLEVGEE